MRVNHEASRKQALQLLRVDRVVHEERVRPPLVMHEAERRLRLRHGRRSVSFASCWRYQSWLNPAIQQPVLSPWLH